MKYTHSLLFYVLLPILFVLQGCKKNADRNPDFSYTGTLRPGYLLSFHSNVQTCIWSFGDGSKSTDPNPNHTYSDEGTYTVVLTPNNDDSRKVVKTLVIQPRFDFTWTGTPEAGFPITFLSNAPTGVSVNWDFGDGSTSAESSPVHVFANNKSYKVTLLLNKEQSNPVVKEVPVFENGKYVTTLVGKRTWHHVYIDAYPWPPYHTAHIRDDIEMTIKNITPSQIAVDNDTLSYNSAGSNDSTLAFSFSDIYRNINNTLYFNIRSSGIDYYKYTHISAGAGDACDHYYVK